MRTGFGAVPLRARVFDFLGDGDERIHLGTTIYSNCADSVCNISVACTTVVSPADLAEV